MRYRFFLGEDALSAFGAATPRERAVLTQHLQHVAAFPEHSDLTWEHGGFDFHAKRFGRWSITYRIDSPVKRVFILSIDKLTLR